MVVIYKSTNKINGRCYIGKTNNFEARKQGHIKDAVRNTSDKAFHNALRKYGPENFEWSILYESNDEDFCLNIMEPYMIKQYDSYKNGYNMTLGGEGHIGMKEEVKDKIRKKLIGKKLPESTCKKLKEAKARYVYTEEHKKNISLSNKGKKMSDEAKKKMSKAKIGKAPWNKGIKGKQTPWCSGKILNYDQYPNFAKKLSKKDVLEIRRLYKEEPTSKTKKLLRERYKVSNVTIDNVISYVTWKTI